MVKLSLSQHKKKPLKQTLKNKYLAEKQVPVQEVYSLPETGEVTVVGLAFLGLFMTLLAFLGFVDRHTRRN